MRALMVDQDDRTLIVTEVFEIIYNREEKHIYISGPDDDFTISRLEEFEAEDIMKRIYLEGIIDLTMYQAEIE